jgi:hypothetical protein
MIVGSRAFFSGIDGFIPKDTDVLEFIEVPIGFRTVRQIKFVDKCVFQWRHMPIRELIEETLKRGIPMEIGKFLVPEFINTFNLSIDDLKKLQPLVDRLDDAHKYEAIIYNAYIENNDFYLTQSQLNAAYNAYRESRTE